MLPSSIFGPVRAFSGVVYVRAGRWLVQSIHLARARARKRHMSTGRRAATGVPECRSLRAFPRRAAPQPDWWWYMDQPERRVFALDRMSLAIY